MATRRATPRAPPAVGAQCGAGERLPQRPRERRVPKALLGDPIFAKVPKALSFCVQGSLTQPAYFMYSAVQPPNAGEVCSAMLLFFVTLTLRSEQVLEIPSRMAILMTTVAIILQVSPICGLDLD